MRNRGWNKAVLLTLLGCLLAGLVPATARAEDFFTLNVDMLDMDSLNQNDYVAANLSAACQGIRVLKTISTSSELAEPVRLSLTRMDTQTLLFDKDYGYQSRNFDSDVIYLPYGGGSTVPYLVTLYVGDTVYAMPFMQLQPRLQFNSACTYGVRLRDLGLGGDWLMGTMLNLTELVRQAAFELEDRQRFLYRQRHGDDAGRLSFRPAEFLPGGQCGGARRVCVRHHAGRVPDRRPGVFRRGGPFHRGLGGCDRRVYGASVPAHAGQLRPIRSARAFL